MNNQILECFFIALACFFGSCAGFSMEQGQALHTNTEENILLIIDMQDGYKISADRELQTNINNEIEVAEKNQWLIVFIENKGSGATVRSLIKQLGQDARHVSLTKAEDSAHSVLMEFCASRAIKSIDVMRVCGVYTDACVQKTVRDFFDMLITQKTPVKKIIVVADACSTGIKNTHEIALTKMESYGALIEHPTAEEISDLINNNAVSDDKTKCGCRCALF